MRKRSNKLSFVVMAVFLLGLAIFASARTELTVSETKLDIWDSSDFGDVYLNDSIKFYANYTNTTSEESINGSGINCSISLNHTGMWAAPINMTFNGTTLLYESNKTMGLGGPKGDFYFNISCVNNIGHENLSLLDGFTVSNFVPTKPTWIYPANNSNDRFLYNYSDTIPINCSGSTDLETPGEDLNYTIQAYYNNGTNADWRTLTINLTNSTTFYWNLTLYNVNVSQYITLACRASDGENDSQIKYSAGAIIVDQRPILVTAIPDMAWLEDTTNSSLNLTTHFIDMDGDDLNYTYTGAQNMSVSIDNNSGIVTITPNNNFYGNNSIIFYAWDKFGENATSNNVTLTIINTPEVNLSSPGDGSDGFYVDTGVNFYLKVKDAVLIENCSLYIDGRLNQTKDNLDLNTSFMAFNDSGNIGGIGTTNIINYSGAIITEELNLTQNYTNFKAYMGHTDGIGPVIVRINGHNAFNITSAEVISGGGWVNKIITNTSIFLLGQLNNISFEDTGHLWPTNYFILYDDAGGSTLGEYLVRFTNDLVGFDTVYLKKGDYKWNASCVNNQGRDKWSAETWSLTVNNSAPEKPTEITPSSGTFASEINISCLGSTDIDGDEITYTIQYQKESVGTGITYSLVSNDEDGNYTWDVSGVSADNIKLICYASDVEKDSNSKEQTGYPITISHPGAPTPPTALTCNGGPCSNKTFGDEVNLSCYGADDSDSNFNYTFKGYYADYNGLQWYTIASVVNESGFGNYTWDTKNIINQSNITIGCYADDGVNTKSSSIFVYNITIEHPDAPTQPINFNYTTDFKYQTNITANGSVDPNGNSISYRVWAYYDNSWRIINDSLTNETVFYWNISSITEQNIELKCQASDGTYYSGFLTTPTLAMNREPSVPTNLSPRDGNYEFSVNYSCSGSNNSNYFVYYVDAYYDNGWHSLTSSFPGIPVVNDTELAYDDGDYNEVLNQLASIRTERTATINVSNGNYSFCVRGYGEGSSPRFQLYWDCDEGDSGVSSCLGSDGSYNYLSSSDQTNCSDVELTKTGLKYLKIRTTGEGNGRISTHFDHAYLIAKPFTWDVSSENRQRNVNLRCLASDEAGNSSWFNPAGELTINRIPRWNSSKNISYGSTENNTVVWKEDTNLINLFNLDEYFYDIDDSDTLNYSVRGNSNINVVINDTTHNVSFRPNANWYGTETIIFAADDNISNGTSPIITLTVNNDFTDSGEYSTGDGGSDSTTTVPPPPPPTEPVVVQPTTDETDTETEEEPVMPSPPEEGGERDESTQKIIDRRYSIKRNLVVGFGKSQITETITNIDLYPLEEVKVRVTVPKYIAASTDNIDILTPFRIIERDPVIEFDLGTIQPYKEATIVYVIDNVITPIDLNRILVEITPLNLSEEERLRREREIEGKIEETSKVVDIKRGVELNEEEGKVTYTLDVDFKEESVLYNVSIFEEIPKCLLELIEEELIESDFEFEVVSADPLIVWHFDKLTKEQRIQYSIHKLTEEDCANKAKAIALAQQIILFDQRFSPRKAAMPLLAIPIVLLVMIFFSKFGEERKHEEEHINRMIAYAKSEYKKGRAKSDIKTSLMMQGYKEHEIDEALNLNARNKLHHWLVRFEIGIEEVILLFIIAISVLDFLEILPGDLDFLKKLISWVILGYLIYRVSPTNILFGHKSRCVDIGLIAAYFLLIMKDLINFTRNFDIVSEVYYLRDLFLFMHNNEVIFESTLFIAGIAVLALLSIYVALKFEIKQPSMMALLHVHGHMYRKREFISRLILSHLLIIGFFVVVFNLLTEWLAIAVDAPIITAAIFFYIFVLVKHKSRFKATELIFKIGNVGEKFYERFIELFHYKKTLLLGLAGIKLLHQITDIGNFLLPYTFGLADPIYFSSLGTNHNAIFDLLNGHSLFAAETLGMTLTFKAVLALGYLFNIVAMVILLSLPALLWYHMYKYRERPVSQVPMFKLPKWLISSFFASMAVLLTAPALKVGHIKAEGLVGVDVTSHSIAGFGSLSLLVMVAFLVGAVIYLLCFTKLKKYLKRIVILSALGFFAYYMWHYFANVVIYFIKKIAELLLAQPFITTYLIIFLFVNIVFYISGFISYFIELFLRNELGFKAWVQREWGGLLAHHNMHHIHYSASHDELKHGQEVEAIIKFMENELAHSLRPIKTVEKLIHHGWGLELIEEAVNKSGISEEYRTPMLHYILRREERVKPLRDYIKKYKGRAPIKKIIEKAVRTGWEREDIKLAQYGIK